MLPQGTVTIEKVGSLKTIDHLIKRLEEEHGLSDVKRVMYEDFNRTGGFSKPLDEGLTLAKVVSKMGKYINNVDTLKLFAIAKLSKDSKESESECVDIKVGFIVSARSEKARTIKDKNIHSYAFLGIRTIKALKEMIADRFADGDLKKVQIYRDTGDAELKKINDDVTISRAKKLAELSGGILFATVPERAVIT